MKLEMPPAAGFRKAARVLGPGLAMGVAILVLLGWVAAPVAAPADPLGSPIFASDFESGTICAWSTVVGWTGAPCVTLEITITEGGAPLADGALFNRDVVPVLGTTGGTAPITLDATLDGAPFVSGSTVTGDALYLLEVSAEDAEGFIAQRTVHFTIDTLGSRLPQCRAAGGIRHLGVVGRSLGGGLGRDDPDRQRRASRAHRRSLHFRSAAARGGIAELPPGRDRPGREPDPTGAQHRARLALAGRDASPNRHRASWGARRSPSREPLRTRISPRCSSTARRRLSPAPPSPWRVSRWLKGRTRSWSRRSTPSAIHPESRASR